MYKSFKISKQRRKRIATILLVNFLFSTILFAFPQNKCNGICSLDIESHNCSDMTEMTCCDMMDMNNSNSIPCGMEIKDNSCDYVYDSLDEFTFVIPKTIDTKIVFIEITSVTLNNDEKVSFSSLVSQNIIPDVSPPIYLAISSFLI